MKAEVSGILFESSLSRVRPSLCVVLPPTWTMGERGGGVCPGIKGSQDARKGAGGREMHAAPRPQQGI
jgi:hypothetical protein